MPASARLFLLLLLGILSWPAASTAAGQQTAPAAKLTGGVDRAGAPEVLQITAKVAGPQSRNSTLRVTLQQRVGHRWKALRNHRLPASGSVRFDVTAARIVTWPATLRARVYDRHSGRLRATSPSVRVARVHLPQSQLVPTPTVAPEPTSTPALAADGASTDGESSLTEPTGDTSQPTDGVATPGPTPDGSPTPSPTATPTPSPTLTPTGTLPELDIAVADGAPITSKTTYLAATVTLDGESATAQIKGRGNSTWSMPKQPYRLKLDKKKSLLGMASSKHWVLLADWADPSLLRNELAFELGRQTSLAWTPQQRAVEVMLNGEYVGVYHLTQQVRVDADRVNIDVSDLADDPSAGGYLLERDADLSEGDVDCTAEGLGIITPTFYTPVLAGSDGASHGHTPLILHEPECFTPAQQAYISSYLADFETALYSSSWLDPANGYGNFVDRDSFVDWSIVQEVTRNIDASNKSMWFYKPAGGRLTMGPLWDFDITFGSEYTVLAGWTPTAVGPQGGGQALEGTGWTARMFNDPAFDAAARARWQELRPAVVGLRTYLSTRAAALRAAAVRDAERWPRWDSFDDQIDQIDSWLAARIAWLDGRFATSG
ncbi:MAG: CotH kinase family protein [Patulibacter sp.]